MARCYTKREWFSIGLTKQMRTIIVFCMEMLEDAQKKRKTPDESMIRRVTTEQLLGPVREMVILHQGREYRLRITQNGKLILTA